jgi:hypothetical protein
MAWLGRKEHSKIIRQLKFQRSFLLPIMMTRIIFPKDGFLLMKKFSISNAFWGFESKSNYLLLG